MKKLVLVSLFFPLLYLGCGETVIKNEKSDVNVTTLSTDRDLLNQLGLEMQNEKISIDMNKTAKFIQQMEIEMHGKADEIQRKTEKADINFTRDIGITLGDEKVEIDLNKTKKMFQQINILMKEVLLDENSSKY